MKTLLIDLINKIKNNHAAFYTVLIFIIIGGYFLLLSLSYLKPEEARHDPTKQNTQISLNNDKLTYLNSYYFPKKKILEVHLGINNVNSLFNDDNLKATALLQKGSSKKIPVTISKETPQLLVFKINEVNEDYILAKLNIMYTKGDTGSGATKDLFVNHSKERLTSFNKQDYESESIEFKKYFVNAEIKKLGKKISNLDKKKSDYEEDISSLNSDDSILTDDEKQEVKSTIESLKTQIDNTDQQISDLNKELSERQKQKAELESLKEG